MKKYEYKGKSVSVPTSWGEITVATYDKLWNLKPQTARERANTVAIACGAELQTFLEWPREIFEMVLKDVDFLFQANPAEPYNRLEIDGAQYVVAVEERLTFAEFIDVDMVQKEDAYASAIVTNVLAIICRPPGEAYDPVNIQSRVEMFGALPVSKVLGVLAFFLRSYQTSTKSIALYANLQATAGQLPKNIKLSQMFGGGIRLSRIYQTIRFYVLMRLLFARLQKYSHFYYTNAQGVPQKLRSASLIGSGIK